MIEKVEIKELEENKEIPLKFEIECDGNLIRVKTSLPSSQDNSIIGLANLLRMMKSGELASLIEQTLEGRPEYSVEQNTILQNLRAVLSLNKIMNASRPYHPAKIWDKMQRGL